MTDKSWRDSPPAALQLMVFRHTWTMQDDPVLMPVQIPSDLTLENVGNWLRKNADVESGVKYTALLVGTKDVFEIIHIHDEVTICNVTSITY